MSIELLNKRLEYQGGNQQGRFIRDKLTGLKRALLYSYQAATAILQDGKEFRCLINPDKNKPAYDNKILSIPYKDICLNEPRKGKTSEGEIDINLNAGDVFTWKETTTHWLVYLQYLQEDAYFRAQIRRCDQSIQIDGKTYWVYLRGPVETSIEWSQKKGIEWNTLNYSLVMYISFDDTTKDYFERFKLVKIIDPRYGQKKNWQVVGVDPYYGDGIIQVFLDQYYENSIADAAAKQQPQSSSIVEQSTTAAYISGPTQVKQYGRAYYQICNATQQGKWLLSKQNIEHDLNYNNKILPLDIPGIIGNFTLIYRIEGQEDITLDVSIVSL